MRFDFFFCEIVVCTSLRLIPGMLFCDSRSVEVCVVWSGMQVMITLCSSRAKYFWCGLQAVAPLNLVRTAVPLWVQGRLESEWVVL